MPQNDYMPKYQCWSEADFQSDRQVQRMPFASRHLYRALLQAAFICPTRPHLPDDDEQLYLLADAADLEYWNTHKGPVLKMFTAFTDDDERQLLGRMRLQRDWDQMIESVDQKKRAGRARHGKSASAEQATAGGEQGGADALKLKTEKKSKTEKKVNRNETEPETETDSVSVSGSVTKGSSTDDIVLQQAAEQLLQTWIERSGQTGSVSDFLFLLKTYDDVTTEFAADQISVAMGWALAAGRYWSSNLVGSHGFKNAYKEICRQCLKYQQTIEATARDRQREKAPNRSASREFEDPCIEDDDVEVNEDPYEGADFR